MPLDKLLAFNAVKYVPVPTMLAPILPIVAAFNVVSANVVDPPDNVPGYPVCCVDASGNLIQLPGPPGTEFCVKNCHCCVPYGPRAAPVMFSTLYIPAVLLIVKPFSVPTLLMFG